MTKAHSMGKLPTLSKLFARFCMGAGGGFVCANLAFAGVQDSRFAIDPDGTNVEFDVRETPRREVLDRLFAHSGITITWLNAASGDELISGTFSGTPAAVARRLLAQTNFVIVYGGGDDKSRVSRVLIIGRAKGEQGFPIAQDLSKLLFAQTKSEVPPADGSRPETGRAVTSSGGTGTSGVTVPSNLSVPVIEPVVPEGGIPVIEPVEKDGGIPVITPVPAATGVPRITPAPIAGDR
jgi:hypothetical protein